MRSLWDAPRQGKDGGRMSAIPLAQHRVSGARHGMIKGYGEARSRVNATGPLATRSATTEGVTSAHGA